MTSENLTGNERYQLRAMMAATIAAGMNLKDQKEDYNLDSKAAKAVSTVDEILNILDIEDK